MGRGDDDGRGWEALGETTVNCSMTNIIVSREKENHFAKRGTKNRTFSHDDDTCKQVFRDTWFMAHKMGRGQFKYRKRGGGSVGGRGGRGPEGEQIRNTKWTRYRTLNRATAYIEGVLLTELLYCS